VVPVLLGGLTPPPPDAALQGPQPLPKGLRQGHDASGSRGRDVMVVESVLAADGSRVRFLRSLCQVVNSTTLALEVGAASR